ncbi:MAG: adenosylcobinamide-phosphate synthase CbiB [Alphaproteobacteria bacterium]|nr:adenosylcobinamide-phosphate synthase CbiB [Alphaproteobacteria bacterium]
MFEFVFPIQAVFLALALDLLFGEPKWLYARISHPIVWIGGLISALEGRLYRARNQIFHGAVLVAITVALCAAAGCVIAWLARQTGLDWILTGIVGSVFLAARSLYDHVVSVARGLSRDLDTGRAAVSQIVGRNPSELDQAGVARAALESLAENFSDGVVAPLFWFLLAGLPGLLAYKAINTLDSMIGHRNERYLYFGRVAARLDDVVNWPAARIAGCLLCLGGLLAPGMDAGKAWRIMWRDGGKHASPNAGWPEAAMAGALGIALAGPRVYDGELTDDPWLGDGDGAATEQDIARGCTLYRWTCAGILLALLALALP